MRATCHVNPNLLNLIALTILNEEQ